MCNRAKWPMGWPAALKARAAEAPDAELLDIELRTAIDTVTSQRIVFIAVKGMNRGVVEIPLTLTETRNLGLALTRIASEMDREHLAKKSEGA